MIIVGIDPSLTGTGVAVVDTDDRLAIETHTIVTKPDGTSLDARLARLRHIMREVDRHVLQVDDEASPVAHLVVIEAPSLGQGRQGGTLDRHGLWWLLIDRLHNLGRPVAIVAPAARAKYATGKGTASKEAVLLAVERRWPQADVANNNEADAVVLACMGADAYDAPIGDIPRANADALSKVDWPELTS